MCLFQVSSTLISKHLRLFLRSKVLIHLYEYHRRYSSRSTTLLSVLVDSTRKGVFNGVDLRSSVFCKWLSTDTSTTYDLNSAYNYYTSISTFISHYVCKYNENASCGIVDTPSEDTLRDLYVLLSLHLYRHYLKARNTIYLTVFSVRPYSLYDQYTLRKQYYLHFVQASSLPLITTPKRKELFLLSEYSSNVNERALLTYPVFKSYLHFLYSVYNHTNLPATISFLLFVHSGEYLSYYERLLRYEEWILFGLYKKEVMKYHLNL